MQTALKQAKFDHSRYIKAGIDTGEEASHSSMELFRKIMLGISILALATHTVFFLLFIYFSIPVLAIFNCASMVLYGFAYYLCTRREPMIAWFITMAEVISHAIVATIILGWSSGFHLLMILVLPVLCFGYQKFWQQKVPIGTIVIGSYIWLDLTFQHTKPIVTLSPQVIQAMHMVNLFIFLFFLAFLCGLYELIARRSEKKLSEYATTDPLTQLKNRRAIIACAEIELARQKRTEQPITFALCDIDHFKKINDTYGHDVGDKIIQTVADILKSSTRATDFVGRWGGEEFIILLPETPVDKACVVIERIRVKLQGAIQNIHKNATDLMGMNVTMTFGLAEQQAGDALASIDLIIDRADKNLYKGKREGRNRIVF